MTKQNKLENKRGWLGRQIQKAKRARKKLPSWMKRVAHFRGSNG